MQHGCGYGHCEPFMGEAVCVCDIDAHKKVPDAFYAPGTLCYLLQNLPGGG